MSRNSDHIGLVGLSIFSGHGIYDPVYVGGYQPADAFLGGKMIGLFAFGIICVAGAIFLRRPWRDLWLGIHLARMTTVLEEIERTRHTMPIGAGGGVDSLPLNRQKQAEGIFANGLVFMRRIPRHEVTAALTKNAILAAHLGRQERIEAISKLLDILIKHDVALNEEDFLKSYS